MIRLLRARSALICVSVCFFGHICAGQVAPPPPQTAPPPVETLPAPVPATASTASGENAPAQAPLAPPQNDPPATKPASPDGTPKETASPLVTAPATVASPPEKAPEPVVPTVSAKDDGPIGKPYVIGALDVLEVKVWKAANLNGFYTVGSDGMIQIPLLGQIRADGYTELQLAGVVRDRLALKVFAEPPDINEITVQTVRSNSKKYYVYGAVMHQGEFPLVGPTTVMEAFANTGGFQPFAKTSKIYVLRGTTKIPFNYKDVSQGKNLKQNILLQPGDAIFVKD